MKTFSQWLETTNWFGTSDYRPSRFPEDKVYNISKLAAWAKDKITPTKLSIADIEARYMWAEGLFTKNVPKEWLDRSMSTDLSFPIIMLQYPDGKWEIIDGNHRAWKAWNEKEDSIKGYLIKSDQMPEPNEI
jgi:hypothetical protein